MVAAITAGVTVLRQWERPPRLARITVDITETIAVTTTNTAGMSARSNIRMSINDDVTESENGGPSPSLSAIHQRVLDPQAALAQSSRNWHTKARANPDANGRDHTDHFAHWGAVRWHGNFTRYKLRRW
jgi:hypothetical protein